MTMHTHHLHRRKSSKEEDNNIVLATRPMQFDELPEVALMPPPSSRSRVQSTPIHAHHTHSRSVSVASPGISAPPTSFRNGSNFPRLLNGLSHSASPFQPSFAQPSMAPSGTNGRSRTRSISAFTPSAHSPASGFPATESSTPRPFPSLNEPHPSPDTAPRRHQRLHSRNLSIFFPRPGSLPHKSISEDDQEVGVRVDEEAPIALTPSAGSSVRFPGSGEDAPPLTPLGANFTFGGRPPSLTSTTPDSGTARMPTSSTTARRGHHHKHSMSHNFFSFLEPGANLRPPSKDELHTQPTPVPLSPWAPKSNSDAAPHRIDGPHPTPHERDGDGNEGNSQPGVIAAGFLQFVLGASLWVCGQQNGSLSITGLGYWVVFDAFGVGLCGFLPRWFKLRPKKKGETLSDTQKRKLRRPYGNAPVETVLMFAQAVYLMFAAVYVCKETVEHLLLSVGGEDGHHHHHGDEDESLTGIDFHIILVFVTLMSIAGTSLVFHNHSKLINVTGNRITSLRMLFRSVYSSPRSHFHESPPTTPFRMMLSNPYTSSPLVFCAAILLVALMVPIRQQRTCDLALATIMAIVTFKIAYRACSILGTVLLQTAPARGSSSGKMEAFLRAMREIERHPQVLHLPAPHIWQLSPSPSLYLPAASGKTASSSAAESLVVTLELHVKPDLGDDDVLRLTDWAWEKCAKALGDGKQVGEGGRHEGLGRGGGPEVTVGVVRG